MSLSVTNFRRQFIGSPTRWTLLGLAIASVIGYIGFEQPWVQGLMLMGLIGFAAYLYLKHPTTAIVLVLAELFAFSHGRLFALGFGGFLFTSRMAIFLGVMVPWLVLVLLGRRPIRLYKPLAWPLVVIAVAGVIGVAVGLMNNAPALALDDANGYMFLALLFPVMSHAWTQTHRLQVIQSFTGMVLWMGGLSVALLYAFSHFDPVFLSHLYRVVRDLRIAEVTAMDLGYWRIFLQSQLVLLYGILLLAGAYLFTQKRAYVDTFVWVASIVGAGFVISLSRSFWLGLLVAAPVLVYGALRNNPSRALKKSGVLVGVAFLSVALPVAAALFPPTNSMGFQATLSSRTTSIADNAVTSRWNLLPVMWKGIVRSPVIGSGFGHELEFESDDPRIRAQFPDGRWTTYKFEWGWLDQWLKMGVLGLVGFVWLFAAFDAYIRKSASPDWLKWSLRAAVIALLLTHMFSPYLNHPLGAGLWILILVLIERKGEKEAVSNMVEQQSNEPLPIQAAPAQRTECG